MVEYFRQRQGPMAKDGIGALQKSLAAIYYLPFQVHAGPVACCSRPAALRCWRVGLMPAASAVWSEPLLPILRPVHPQQVRLCAEGPLRPLLPACAAPCWTAVPCGWRASQPEGGMDSSSSPMRPAQVLADRGRSACINTVGTIVWHVAAHEIGHAIYGLDGAGTSRRHTRMVLHCD